MKTDQSWPTVVCECAPADLRDVSFDLACITYKVSHQTETASGFRLKAVPCPCDLCTEHRRSIEVAMRKKQLKAEKAAGFFDRLREATV
jgi:hypothetical protein